MCAQPTSAVTLRIQIPPPRLTPAASTVPAAPSNLTATAVSTSQINLSLDRQLEQRRPASRSSAVRATTALTLCRLHRWARMSPPSQHRARPQDEVSLSSACLQCGRKLGVLEHSHRQDELNPLGKGDKRPVVSAGSRGGSKDSPRPAPEIATGSSDIPCRTSDIATRTSDITTRTSDIATWTSDITTRTSDIATWTSDITTRTSDIATWTSDIATRTSDIAT